MKELSMTEFSNFCKSNPSLEFIYSTDEQKDGDLSDVKITHRYKKVACALSPNIICFLDNDNTLTLSRVKLIYITKVNSINRLKVICGNSKNELEDRHVIMRFKEV